MAKYARDDHSRNVLSRCQNNGGKLTSIAPLGQESECEGLEKEICDLPAFFSPNMQHLPEGKSSR